MKITYDQTADAAYISFVEEIGPGGVARTIPVDPREMQGMVNIDLDAEGRLVGIEVMDARALLPPELLAQASE